MEGLFIVGTYKSLKLDSFISLFYLHHHVEPDKALANMERAIKAKATKVVYMHRIREFKEQMKAKTYSDLLNIEKEKLEDSIASYIDWLNGRKLAAKTIRLCMSAIRLFYVSNRKELNWEWIHKQLPSVDKQTEDRLYAKEELRRTLDKCDERKRVMFLLLYSTGMRIGALPGLKIGDLTKIEEHALYKIKVYAGTKSQYITFSTPECAQAIDGYLQYRRERGEVLKPSSPLIRKQFNRERPNDVEPMSLEAIVAVLDDLIYDAGLRKKGERYKRQEVMRFHAWRKACNTAMIEAGVNAVDKEMMLGHRVGLENSYYRPSDAKLLTEYLKAIDQLSISEEKQLRHQVEKLKTEVSDIELMKKSYLELKLQADQKEVIHTDALTQMADTIGQLQKEIELLKKK